MFIIFLYIDAIFSLQYAQIRKLRQCRKFTTIADKSIKYTKNRESSSSDSDSTDIEEDGECPDFFNRQTHAFPNRSRTLLGFRLNIYKLI